MKNKGVFFALIFSSFAFFSLNVKAADVELVQNGNFESGNANWDGVGSLTDIINSDIFDGDYFAFVGFEGEYDEIYQQSIDLPSDATSINMRFNYLFDYAGGNAVVAILDEDDGLTPLSGITFNSDDDTGSYVGYINGNISAYAGKTVTIVVAVDNSANSNNNSVLFIDNISIMATTPASNSPVPLYRFWSKQNKGHFFTASGQEKSSVETKYTDYQWKYEGIAYQVFEIPVADTFPVYRFWSAKNRGHFFTASESEKDNVIAKYTDYQWKYEGIAFYVYKNPGAGRKPVYRFWSAKNRHHFFTASESEKDNVIAKYTDYEWKYEGIAWYVPE